MTHSDPARGPFALIGANEGIPDSVMGLSGLVQLPEANTSVTP